ncbi:MAG: hypothetical protein R3F11_19305 [Verrucomicrobiales bacterium]
MKMPMLAAAPMVESCCRPLVSEPRAVRDLAEPEIGAMWALYSRYYGGTSEPLFRADLARKTDVILSRDAGGGVRGFSTIEVSRAKFEGEEIAVIFSGDTIIDHRFWAKNDFAFAWLRFAAAAKSRAPGIPLYWLLIVKGHRTYRYLHVFACRYFPAPGWGTPAREQRLIDQLAGDRFGSAYHPARGIVRFPDSHGHLKPEWAAVPVNARARPEVAYFLRRNPGYASGDELVCLCEIAEDNMKGLTRRVFRQGLAEPHPAA